MNPIRSPVQGFDQSEVPTVGLVTFLVSFGNHTRDTTIAVRFTVVRMDSSYNIILSRLSLHALRAVRELIFASVYEIPNFGGHMCGEELSAVREGMLL